MISRKTLKSGLYFYDNDLIGNGTCLTIIVVFSARDSTHGFVTRLQNVFFPFPLIIKIFIDVNHYIENNVGFILHGFVKKL